MDVMKPLPAESLRGEVSSYILAKRIHIRGDTLNLSEIINMQINTIRAVRYLLNEVRQDNPQFVEETDKEMNRHLQNLKRILNRDVQSKKPIVIFSCDCTSYDCKGECCGIGKCTCTPSIEKETTP